MTKKYLSLEHSIRKIVEENKISEEEINENKAKIIKSMVGSALKWGGIAAAGSAAYDYLTKDENKKDLFPDQERPDSPIVDAPPKVDKRSSPEALKKFVPKTAKSAPLKDYGAYKTYNNRKISESTSVANKVKEVVKKNKKQNSQVIFEPKLKIEIDESAVGTIAKRSVPLLGLGLGAYDAYQRVKKGDYAGAALSGAAGVASTLPGIGTKAAIGLTAAQLARDYYKKTGAFEPDEKDSEPEQKSNIANTSPQKTSSQDDKVDSPSSLSQSSIDRSKKGDKLKSK